MTERPPDLSEITFGVTRAERATAETIRLPDDFDASMDFDSVADSVHRSRPARNLGVDSGAPGD